MGHGQGAWGGGGWDSAKERLALEQRQGRRQKGSRRDLPDMLEECTEVSVAGIQ